MKLSAALPALFAAAGLLAVSQASAVTPVEKVIALLTDLKSEVEAEGKAEAESYNEFACFCSKLSSGKSSSILQGRDDIASLSAEIASKTALKVTKETENTERTARQGKLEADKKATEVQCAADEAEYMANAADLSKAISGLEAAKKALTDSKPAGAALLALKSSLRTAFALAESLQFKGAKHGELAAFLQQAAGVDPLDPTYKFHSQGIIDTIATLLQEFTDKKKDLDDEWLQTKTACDKTITGLEADMQTNGLAMAHLAMDIENLKSDVALARTNLLYAEAMLKDDQLYLKDHTERCELRAKDWDQRSQLRADELEAISGALAILEQNVSRLDVVNVRALLQKPAPNASAVSSNVSGPARGLRGAPALVQALSAEVRSHGFLRSQDKASLEARQQKVAGLLSQEGARLHSTALTVLASRLAADPFEKVKKLIQQLIERLLSEATAEATKKGFCDEELGKARKDRDYRYEDVQKLNAELALLEAKQDELAIEIKELAAAITDLNAALLTATDDRALERANNLAILKDAGEGLVAVREAVKILKVFYKRAGKATVLVQASPIDETDGPGFEGAYRGKQEASRGIIGMLEVIQTDFERTIRTTKAAEAQSQADFVEFDRASRTDISGKETKKKLDEEDLATVTDTIEQKMQDLQTAMDLLDSTLKAIEALKPTCIDSGMSYQERVAKREEEITALKKALCILDPEGKEAGCP